LIDESIFNPRPQECDSHHFYHTKACTEAMFDTDWRRTCQPRFLKFCRSNGDEPLNETRFALRRHYRLLTQAYAYFSCISGDPFRMQNSEWVRFATETKIASATSTSCRPSDIDAIFKLVNIPEKYREGGSGSGGVNVSDDPESDKAAFGRGEFLHGIVRLAQAKFATEIQFPISNCVFRLCEEYIKPNVPMEVICDDNIFRRDRMYNEQNDIFFQKYNALTAAMHKFYAVYRLSGKTLLKPEAWMSFRAFWAFLKDADFIDDFLTKREVVSIFVSSKMETVDETDVEKMECLSLTDFLEALTRLADYLCFPPEGELRVHLRDPDMEKPTTAYFLTVRRRPDRRLPRRPSAGRLGREQESKVSRPMPVKLEALFEVLIAQLCEALNVGTPHNAQRLTEWFIRHHNTSSTSTLYMYDTTVG